MKALIWKELRENFRWALLAMLALGGAEIYALFHSSSGDTYDIYHNDGITLCKKPFLMVTVFGSAAVGALLGFLQVLPELKRDRWAALLHRPVTRGRFFWGKAIAGALLYLIAAGVPLAVSIRLVATPGNFNTPFVPEMMTPGIADLVAGLCYYFAALAVALQGGRIAWRVLPLLAAIHVSFFTVNERLFRVAVEAGVAMALVLCLAGWGAIYARDSLRGRPRLGQLAFLIAAFYGVCGLGHLAKMFGGMAGDKDKSRYSNWQVLESGVPARLDYVDNVLVSAKDPEGRSFTEEKFRLDRLRMHTLGMNGASSYIGDSHGWRQRPWVDPYRESRTYLYGMSPYSHPRFEQWFHLRKPGIFVGMRPAEKTAFATLGADGFAPPGAPVRGFPPDLDFSEVRSDVISLATRDSLRFAYFAKREIVPVDLGAPGPIYGAAYAWSRTATGSIGFLGIALESGMAVYDGSGRRVTILPYHHDIGRWGEVWFGVMDPRDRFILQYRPSAWIDGKTKSTMPSYVENVDARGNVLASFTLAPLPSYVNSATWSGFVADQLESPGFFFGEMLYRRIGAAFGSSRLRDTLTAQLGRNFKSTAREAAVALSISLVLAVLTFVLARRAQFASRSVWTWNSFVLAFGLGGFVVFWLVAERPRVVRCPRCAGLRRIDQEHCQCCGSGWPENSTDGTEIFDRDPLPAST